MASIEQDDIFNIQDDEMLDEDDGQQEDYNMGDNGDDGEEADEVDGNNAENDEVNDDGMEDSDGEGDGDDDEDDENDDSDDDDSNDDEADEGNEDDEDDGADEDTNDGGAGGDEDNENGNQDDEDEDEDDDDDREDGRNDAEDGQGEQDGSETKRAASGAKSVDQTAENNEEDKMEIDHDNSNNGDKFANLSPRQKIIQSAKITTEFDIVPSVAIPYASQCQSLAFTEGPKWILTGGEDGFIRKYDFIASIQGKNLLTTAQRQSLVDSVTKAGVITTYWENEQPISKKLLLAANPKMKSSDFTTGIITYEPKVNPVYALEVEKNGYWCLSGLSSGGISLYTMRHNEGSIHHYFSHGDKNKNNGHTDTVSVLKLNQQQDKLLSGSWDKSIRHWDLNSGKCITKYATSTGQLSNIQYRPQGLTDLTISVEETNEPEADGEQDVDSLFGDSDEDENENENHRSEEKHDKKSSNGATSKVYNNESIFMSSSIDGTINIWDVRTQDPVLKFGISEGTPPWCMSSTWSNCGDFIYAGRRNSTVEEFSIKMPHKRSTTGHLKDIMVPNVLKVLQFPKISGPVTALSTMPNNDFILCGSNDNIRLYNLKLYDELGTATAAQKLLSKKPATPFLIIPGHQGGILSCLYVDETGRFMVSASGNRGWGHANYTEAVIVYEIDFEG